MAKLEHVNITVSDAEGSAALYATLFDWQVRWRGEGKLGGRTIHVGSPHCYLALWSNKGQDPSQTLRHKKGKPLNHFGVEVDDLDTVEKRVIAAGLQPFPHDDYEPGRRFYFFDPDGIEVEVVSYA